MESVWELRNNAIFKRSLILLQKQIERILHRSLEMERSASGGSRDNASDGRGHADHRWTKPGFGTLKINVDGAY